MGLLTVTRDMAVRCILFGAFYIPKIGKPISEIPIADLIWAEKIFNKKELEEFVIPLWTLSGYGYGSGYGDDEDIGAMILALDAA